MTIAITFYRDHGRDEVWSNHDLYDQSERNDILIDHVDLARELKKHRIKIEPLFYVRTNALKAMHTIMKFALQYNLHTDCCNVKEA